MVRTGIGSGNLDLLEILLRGPDAWNHWREENSTQVVNLSNANLSFADLIEADFSRANLSGANLSGARLIGADLSRANLIGASLSDANLSDANLIGANLSGADLSGADLSRATISDETNIDSKWKLVHELKNEGGAGKDLRDANLGNANLSNANLIGANLSRANLRRANLSSADLFRANLSIANLSSADLYGANLSGADLRIADLSSADLSSADLSRADLSGADLSGADLSGADLSSADLSGADLSGADLSRADLGGANLSFARLQGAIISDKTLIDDKRLPISDTVASSAPKTLYNFDIKVFDPDVNHSEKEQLQAAIDKYAKACGYEEITVISEKSGSWFKKIRYKIAKLISQDIQEEAIQAGQEFYRSGKSFALNRLEKPGVESTTQIAKATAEILKALENYDDVVLLLGKLIVMKYTNEAGLSKTYMKTISSDLQLKIESTPELLDSPQAIINFLKSQEELPPAIEDRKTLQATPEPLK